MKKNIFLKIIISSILFFQINFAHACNSEYFDDYAIVCGNKEKLIARYFSTKNKKYKKMIIFLHGDMSRGGTLEANDQFFDKIKKSYSNEDAIFIHIIRPGYTYIFNGLPLQSSGNFYERTDNYTPENVHEIGAVIEKLKLYFEPQITLVMGHSGGSNSAAMMAGMFPNLAEKYILFACVCSHNSYTRNYLKILRSPSPEKYIDKITKSAKIIALTGVDDSLTPKYLVTGYVEKLKNLEIDATFIEIKGSHNSLFNTIPHLINAIQ